MSDIANRTSAPVPDRARLSQYVVFRDGWEGIRQSLYDTVIYPAAGASVLTFFALPQGQGTTYQGVGVAGTSPKTLSDTNMLLAGQLPTNQNFLAESIEVLFFPSLYHVTAATQIPAVGFVTTATAVAPLLVNDEWIFRKSGNLIFTIGAKAYLQEAPMGRFPPKTHFEISAGGAGWSAATAPVESTGWRVTYPVSDGRAYMLKPASILLDSNTNFSVSLNWPEGLQAINNVARTTVVLDGYLYRRSQ